MVDAVSAGIQEAPEIVAETYPPLPAVACVRARRIHWLFALPAGLVGVFFPRRMGPHLAVSSWAAAYVAHALSLVYFFGTFFATVTSVSQSNMRDEGLPPLSLSEHLREPFAAFLLLMLEASGDWAVVLGLSLSVAIFEAAHWLAGIALIPFCTVGERRALVYRRCVKLLLWSSACVVPLGYALTWLIVSIDRREYQIIEESIAFFMFAWTIWWVSVLLRLGGRYGGPAEGPGWEPRPLRCEACGYELTTLPLVGRCPECGRPVADSARERRQLPTFARARGPIGWGGYARTAWRSVFSRSFGEAICVRQGHRSARRFAYLTCVIVGLLVALALAPADLLHDDGYPHAGSVLSDVLTLATDGCIGGLLCFVVILVVGLFVTGFGFRDATSRSIVLCYSSAWLMVVTVLGSMGIWGAVLIRKTWLGGLPWVNLPLLGGVETYLLVATVLMLPALAAIGLWILQLRRVLRDTRYANG